jgi:hypothetical protein
MSLTLREKMQKVADRVDRVTQADRLFFERFPHRQHRVRLASQAEIAQYELLEGQPAMPPPGCRVFTVVRNIAPGARLRLYTYGLEGAETDLSEPTARAIFEAAATPRIWEIEAQIRAAWEAASPSSPAPVRRDGG